MTSRNEREVRTREPDDAARFFEYRPIDENGGDRRPRPPLSFRWSERLELFVPDTRQYRGPDVRMLDKTRLGEGQTTRLESGPVSNRRPRSRFRSPRHRRIALVRLYISNNIFIRTNTEYDILSLRVQWRRTRLPPQVRQSDESVPRLGAESPVSIRRTRPTEFTLYDEIPASEALQN